MIDYYTYWGERRVDYWNRVTDKFINHFSRWFFMVLIVIMFIKPTLALGLATVYVIVSAIIAILFGVAIGRYGKVVDNMAYSGYDGDLREVN